MNLSRAVRLSQSFADFTPLRGHLNPHITAYEGIMPEAEIFGAVFLPIHVVTHLHFDDRGSIGDGRRFHPRARTFSAVVLDFTDKQSHLDDYLYERETSRFVFPKKLPYIDVAKLGNSLGNRADTLLKLLKRLEIKSEEVFLKLGEAGILGRNIQETAILLRTDWGFHFNPYKSNLSNRSLEGTAAFLLHPYMTQKTVQDLMQWGLFALGHDLPSLEFPLFFAVGDDVLPHVREARNRHIPRDAKGEITPDVRNTFLKLSEAPQNSASTRFYLTNIKFDELDDNPPLGHLQSGHKHFIGELSIIPIPFLADTRGVACELYFEVKNESKPQKR